MLVRYSAHTKDSMVGKTEEVSEERGERLIATGVAHLADESPEPKPRRNTVASAAPVTPSAPAAPAS